jgi:hypothetical protein
MFNVFFKKKVEKSVKKMPKQQAVNFYNLFKELEENGPVRSNWPNYGILKGTNTHHCHLSHKWVACWVETKQGIEIEVTYAGSRESSPYA